MRLSIPQVLYFIAVIVLGAVLVLVIWQPVLPSGWIIQGLATRVGLETGESDLQGNDATSQSFCPSLVAHVGCEIEQHVVQHLLVSDVLGEGGLAGN